MRRSYDRTHRQAKSACDHDRADGLADQSILPHAHAATTRSKRMHHVRPRKFGPLIWACFFAASAFGGSVGHPPMAHSRGLFVKLWPTPRRARRCAELFANRSSISSRPRTRAASGPGSCSPAPRAAPHRAQTRALIGRRIWRGPRAPLPHQARPPGADTLASGGRYQSYLRVENGAWSSRLIWLLAVGTARDVAPIFKHPPCAAATAQLPPSSAT